MKVLWLLNIIPPAAAEKLGIEGHVTGGWIVGLLNDIVKQDNIELTVCFGYRQTDDIIEGKADGFDYIGYKETPQNKVVFERILQKVQPDIIHVWGTEAMHSLDMMEAATNLHMENKTVINIQGLLSISGKYHYYSHMPIEVINSNRLVEIRYGHRIKDDRNELLKGAEHELKALKLAKNVIGRTDWDEACTTQINPSIHYYHCDASLRESFYENNWSVQECEKHSIFMGSSYWPAKGLHLAIEALSIVKKKYYDAKLYVIGESPLSWYKSRHYSVRQRSYPRYIAKLICDNNLEKSVVFLPSLNEKQMCERYLKSNVFALASTIENESNSLAEAMILGMPVVSSFVGGVTNFMAHNEEGYFYSSDAPYMLAYYICKVFEDDDRAVAMGQRAREHALKSYDRENNLKTMLSIYDKIVNESKNKET